jgi:hypothetical protein
MQNVGATPRKRPVRLPRQGLPAGESDVNAQIRSVLHLFPWIRLYRNNTGRRGRVSYGLCVGSADWIGLNETGRFIAIEAKDDEGVVSDEQKAWLAEVRRMNGFATVVRNVAEFMAACKRIREGKSE